MIEDAEEEDGTEKEAWEAEGEAERNQEKRWDIAGENFSKVRYTCEVPNGEVIKIYYKACCTKRPVENPSVYILVLRKH